MKEGEFVIIPKDIEHCPNADDEFYGMLMKPKSTVNTGDIENDMTKTNLGRV